MFLFVSNSFIAFKMIVVRKCRGKQTILPEGTIKSICLHELALQTLKSYAAYSDEDFTVTTNNLPLTLNFIQDNLEILANPYSKAQERVAQALMAVINHENSLKLIQTHFDTFKIALENLHQNLNYNIILDCTVFKTPRSYLKVKPNHITTYYLIIQTKPITAESSLLKNLSEIKRKNIT